ncbi:MAG: hypothetical protein ACRD3E_15225 [Terriglobales bacterium]
MREIIKRVDPNWIRMWLVVYGGSISVLTAYLLSVVLRVGGEYWGME